MDIGMDVAKTLKDVSSKIRERRDVEALSMLFSLENMLRATNNSKLKSLALTMSFMMFTLETVARVMHLAMLSQDIKGQVEPCVTKFRSDVAEYLDKLADALSSSNWEAILEHLGNIVIACENLLNVMSAVQRIAPQPLPPAPLTE